MRVLITGICGFVGSALADALLARRDGVSITGIDNLMRPGSEMNRLRLRRMGVQVIHGDIRAASDWEQVGPADWVIDAAANPSVLAGMNGGSSSRALFEHNLGALVNVLEYCKAHRSGLLLLSSSRVYSIPALLSIPLRVGTDCFCLDTSGQMPRGLSPEGIGPEFPTAVPISLYGCTKLASEIVALEYGCAFGFPVWVVRCGVLAGAGQFGGPDQGIFSYWINAHLRRRSLRYFGFGGTGRQVRDVFHPRDLSALLDRLMGERRLGGQRIYTAGGGLANSASLAQLTAWCDSRFGIHVPVPDGMERPYDVGWVVMDSGAAKRDFGWEIETGIGPILEEIAEHAMQHPDWLERSGL